MGLPNSKTKTWINCSEFSGVPSRHGGNLSTCAMKRLQELSLFSLEKRWLWWDPTAACRAYRKIIEKTEPNSSVTVAGRQETMSIS